MIPHPTVTEDIIERALREDVGSGDLTTEAIVPADATTTATIVAKEPGIIAGLFMVERVLQRLDARASVECAVNEGDSVDPDELVASVRGPVRALLTGERTVLNFLQRMSGIATLTREYVDDVAGTGATICDTRKTAPGLRVLDKYAVRAGGGTNHRMGLFDAVLIKENHVTAAGGIAAAVEAANGSAPHTATIEVECESLAEVEEALDAQAEIIMLDNMSPEEMRQAVELVDGNAIVEASGNVTLDTVQDIAETGVDLISVGELTHSVKALDLSMLIAQA